MKKAIAFLVMAILLSGVSGIMGCAHQGTSVLGSYVNPISGARYEFVRAADADPWGNDHGVIYAVATDNFGKNINPNELAMQNGASSPGIGKQGTVAFIQGAAGNAGPWFPLLRPEGGSTQVNQGGNAQQSQGQRMKQQQQQNQNQVQVQSQNQTALGGAGGAGGSATITNTGGVGNIKTISNDANGNGTILGGNIF